MQIVTHSARHSARHNNNNNRIVYYMSAIYWSRNTRPTTRSWEWRLWTLEAPGVDFKASLKTCKAQLAAGRSQLLSGDVATAAATVTSTANAEFQRTKLTNWLNHWLSTWLTDCVTDCLTACLPNSFAEKCLERLSKGLSSPILLQPSIQVLPILSQFAFLSSCLELFFVFPRSLKCN